MSYATKKGYDGEIEACNFFQSLVTNRYHFERIGGVEFNKGTYAGDIHLIPFCKKHNFKGVDINDCIFNNYFLEVKTQAKPDIWSAIRKAEDDGRLAGKIGAIGYFVKQKRGTKGERLVAMRPETFKRFLER